jgi:hypothetical protein
VAVRRRIRFSHKGAGNFQVAISREIASASPSLSGQDQLKRGIKSVAVDDDSSAASREAF